jgi:hypothetical protein
MLYIYLLGCSDTTYYDNDAEIGLTIEISEKLDISSSNFIISKTSSGMKRLGMMLEGSLGRTGGTYNESYPELKILKYYMNGGISSETCSFISYPHDNEKTFLKVREWNEDNPNNKIEINNNAYIGSCELGSWSSNYLQKVYIYQ